MMTYRLIPLSARSISLDSTFKDEKPHNSYSFMLITLFVENFINFSTNSESASNSSSFDTHINFCREIFLKSSCRLFLPTLKWKRTQNGTKNSKYFLEPGIFHFRVRTMQAGKIVVPIKNILYVVVCTVHVTSFVCMNNIWQEGSTF
jgi:hypothetical protein